MTTQQFLLVVGTIIVVLLASIGIERYRKCQELGGNHCRVGRY